MANRTAEAAAIIARLIPELKCDSVANNAITIEGILNNLLKPQCMYCGYELEFKNEGQINLAIEHITSCERSPLVQQVRLMEETLGPARDFMLKIEELLKEKAIAVDNLTRTQLADAICQAIQCGDFQRHLVRGEDRQQIVYVPFQREHELKSALNLACDVIEKHHKWHQEYDEHGGYPDSELCDDTVVALKYRML